jgi:hypothetical protein
VHHGLEPGGIGLAARQRGRERDVLDGAERRDQVEGLEDEADLVPPEDGELAVVEGREVGVADEDAPTGQVVESGHAVHERRLAGARRAHDGRELAGTELDVDVVEGGDAGVPRAVDLGGADGAGGDAGGRSGGIAGGAVDGGGDGFGHWAALLCVEVSSQRRDQV